MGVLVAGTLVLFGAVVAGERSVAPTGETDSLGESFVTGRPVGELGREALPGAFVALLGVLVVWQVAAAVLPNASVFLPPPSDVLTTLSSPGLFVAAGYATGKKLLVGWLLGAGVGIALGVCIRLVPWLRTVLYPYLVGVRVMPQIAVAPLLLVWFGVSFEAAAVVVALSTFFPLAVGTVDGLAATPNEHVELLRSVDAPRWREVLFVRFRHAVPSLFAGVKLSVVTALVGTVIAGVVRRRARVGCTRPSGDVGLRARPDLRGGGLSVRPRRCRLRRRGRAPAIRLVVTWRRTAAAGNGEQSFTVGHCTSCGCGSGSFRC